MMIVWRQFHLAARRGQQAVPPPRYLQGRSTVHYVAEARYASRPYEGAVSLICIGLCRNEDKWRGVAAKSLEIISLPPVEGSPPDAHPMDAPYLNELTNALKRLLQGL